MVGFWVFCVDVMFPDVLLILRVVLGRVLVIVFRVSVIDRYFARICFSMFCRENLFGNRVLDIWLARMLVVLSSLM